MEGQENKKLTKNEKRALKKQNKAKKSSADKKGIVLNIILGIVTVVLLFNAVSAYKKDLPETNFSVKFNLSEIQSAPVVLPDTAPIVTVPQVTVKPEEIPEKDNSENGSTDTAPETQKGELSKQEILKVVADGVNALKAENATYKGVKSQNLSIDLTECSVPALVGVANTVIDLFEGEEVLEYNFENGKAFDPEDEVEITAAEAFPPTGKPFSLTDVNGVAEAKTEKDGDNTVYTVVLVAETSTLEDPRPPYHDSACDTLDYSTFELPMGQITKADFEYPGATVSITLDKDGRVVGYHERLNMAGVGEGTAIGLTASGRMEGYIDESWVISY